MRQDLEKAKASRAETAAFLKKLHQKQPKALDTTVADLHEEVFAKIDCLECANCCKTTSPIFTDRDIERIARVFRLKPSAFVEAYLHLDADNDYVLNQAPCPFLAQDNTCQIYEDRPKACREYPHTNRKRFHQIWKLTLHNAEICPATHRILEQLKAAKLT